MIRNELLQLVKRTKKNKDEEGRQLKKVNFIFMLTHKTIITFYFPYFLYFFVGLCRLTKHFLKKNNLLSSTVSAHMNIK